MVTNCLLHASLLYILTNPLIIMKEVRVFINSRVIKYHKRIKINVEVDKRTR